MDGTALAGATTGMGAGGDLGCWPGELTDFPGEEASIAGPGGEGVFEGDWRAMRGDRGLSIGVAVTPSARRAVKNCVVNFIAVIVGNE